MKHDLCLRSWRGNLCIFLSLFIYASLNGQAVGINEDGSDPDPASILDVKSLDKGVLFPRMSEGIRLEIPSPPEGLMVWDTTHNSIWGFDGTQWRELSSKWESVPNGIQNIHTGNVGIGETSSSYSLYIRKPVPSIGFYDDNYPASSGFIRGDSTAIEIQAFRASPFASSNPGNLIMQTTNIVGGAIPFVAGNVGIGVTNPQAKLHIGSNVLIGSMATPADGYLLSVDGKVMAEEMRIEDSGGWPDYVFEPDYNLKSLEDLKKEIVQKGYLPGIPSSDEVEQEGILVGDMQKRQMEKIEELTLYILQLHERIEKLEEKLVDKKTAQQ